jgi:hypothetical protein
LLSTVGLVIAALTCGGCGGAGDGTVLVSGQITINGQSPPAPGIIYFIPTSTGGVAPRPATAQFDTSGEFTAQGSPSSPGLKPGQYGLTVDCWKTAPSMGGPPAVSYVNKKYEAIDTSGLVLEIPSDGDDEIVVNYDLEGPAT